MLCLFVLFLWRLLCQLIRDTVLSEFAALGPTVSAGCKSPYGKMGKLLEFFLLYGS
jgi:hypothetical protein